MPLKKRPDGKYDTGRPTVMTAEVIRKLHEAFCVGATDLEACSFAEIAPQTLYNFQKENPDFLEWKEGLKLKPVLKARMIVDEALDCGDKSMAKWYLERKARNEFGVRTEMIGTVNTDSNSIPVSQTIDIEKIKQLKEMLGA